MTIRLERRMGLLLGRRGARMDPAQYALEDRPRGRAARRVRALVRQGVPVSLRHQRWAGARELLADLAIDLEVADATIRASVVNLASLTLHEGPQGWSFLLAICFEQLGLDPPAARVPLSEDAFREAWRRALDLVSRGPRRALLFCGTESLPMRAVELLAQGYAQHHRRAGAGRSIRLVLAARDELKVDLPRQEIVLLPDHGLREGVDHMVELAAKAPDDLLERIVWMLGGVPEFVERAATAPGDMSNPDWRRVLGTSFLQLRQAIALARTHDALAARLDVLGDLEAHEVEAEADQALRQAGLARTTREGLTRVRAPLVTKVDRALTQ